MLSKTMSSDLKDRHKHVIASSQLCVKPFETVKTWEWVLRTDMLFKTYNVSGNSGGAGLKSGTSEVVALSIMS